MTREEEIKQYVKERKRNIPITSSEANLIIESVKWADRTMIEKVCNRLEIRFDEYIVREIRKIMEE